MTGHIAIICPDCNGIEMASTRDAMERSDWTWVGKMLALGWEQKNVTPEQVRGSDFGCKCNPKRRVAPTRK